MDTGIDAPPSDLVRSFLLVPVRPQTYRNLLYFSLAFPLGIIYFVFLTTGFSVGISLVPVLVGIPILGVSVGLAIALAGVERRLVTLLLGLELDPPSEPEGGSTWARVKALLTDLRTWTPLVYLPSVLVLGTAFLGLAVTVFSTGFSMLLVPLYYDQPGLYVGLVSNRPVELHPAIYFAWNNLLVGFETVISLGAWRVTTLTEGLVVAALGVVVCLVGLNATNLLARSWKWYTAVMIGRTYDPLAAVLRALEK